MRFGLTMHFPEVVMPCAIFGAVVLCAFANLSCAGTLDNPAAFSVAGDGGGGAACGDVPGTILAPSCGLSGCHSPPTNQSGMDLSSPGVGARLVDQPASGGPGLIIDSKNPDGSVLLSKVQPNPPFGAMMPLTGPPLSQEQLQCLRAWVAAQAAAGGTPAPADASTE